MSLVDDTYAMVSTGLIDVSQPLRVRLGFGLGFRVRFGQEKDLVHRAALR